MNLGKRLFLVSAITAFLGTCIAVVVARTHRVPPQLILRVGYFPNVTHAQGLIGAQSSREGKGWFEQRLGEDVVVHWYAYNAGPSAMEALLAGSIDMTYVGPNPALNVYIRSAGSEVRIMAGSAEGGAALVVRKDAGFTSPESFRGRRIATPQLGNTQDVAARAWFIAQGFRVTLTGGDVQVIPTANADQLSLFTQGRLDGAWTVEPWVSRLVLEGKGSVYLEQKDAITTVLVSGVEALKTKPDLVARFVAAHRELTAWINTHPDEARERVRRALSVETKRDIAPALIASAWSRLTFTDGVSPERFESLVRDAQSVGFLRNAISLNRLFSRAP